jgi:2-keto-3-deoxy-L-rhamnonate aldolase RhmA
VESEHELHDLVKLTDFIVSAKDNGLPVMVSAPTIARHFISRILDAGALAIMMPHAETPEEVETVARWMKYPPLGERAVAFGPNTDSRIPDVARYCEEANEATMIVLKIESRKGIENAEAMLSTGWVDGVVFGPVDLSVEWGVPGQPDHPEIAAAVERVSRMAMSRGIAVVGQASDRATYERERERGAQLFFLPSEIELIREAALDFMKRVS